MRACKCLSLIILTVLMACGFLSCQQVTPFDRIPRNGFISHFEESDGSRMPFDSYWDISDNEDWNERVRGDKNKSQAVYVKPITLDYFQKGSVLQAKSPAVIKLRDYFEDKLMAELKKQDASENSFHLVNAPGKDVYTVEIALLSGTPTRILNNTAAMAAGFVIRGSNYLISSKQDTGSLCMGIRFYAPNGRLVAEIADFEYGKKSLPGMIIGDSKDFRPYAYHRRIIDGWVGEIVQVFTTIHEQKIKRPWYSLNPF